MDVARGDHSVVSDDVAVSPAGGGRLADTDPAGRRGATPMAQMTIKQALELAVQHQQAGRLADAQGLYQTILRADPNHPDALHLLGTIALQTGNFHEAADLIGRAIRAYPAAAHYHCNLGHALASLGQLEQAIAS